MTRFIFLRHGFSVGNQQKRSCGHFDFALTEEGVLQAQRACEYIRTHYRVDAILSSDLQRAVETVHPLSEALHLPIQTDTALREISTGAWAGRLYENIRRDDADCYRCFRKEPGAFTFPGGESYLQAALRYAKGLERLAPQYDGKTVVVGTHAGVLRAVFMLYEHIPFVIMNSVRQVANASVTVGNFEENTMQWLCYSYNEYLKEGTTALMP